MMMNNTVPILYPPGFYGHYIHLLLDNFTMHGRRSSINSFRFDCYGSAHNQDYPFNNMKWSEYVSHNKPMPFFMCHLYDYNMIGSELYEHITSQVKKCILIEYDSSKMILAANNVFDKRCQRNMRKMEILLESPNLIGNTVSEWREYFSYKLFYDDWLKEPLAKKDNVIRFTLEDILYHPTIFLRSVAEFLGTSVVNMNKMLDRHRTMMAFQQHTRKDTAITNFLIKFEQNIPCKLIDNRSIIDEAYIQKYLREKLNMDLHCNDIGDYFPNTVEKLKDYIHV